MTPAETESYYHRGVHFGADGGLVRDNDLVWALPVGEYRQLDYFFGMQSGEPLAQDIPDKQIWRASELLSHRGYVC